MTGNHIAERIAMRVGERSLSESLSGSPTSTSIQMLTKAELFQNIPIAIGSALGVAVFESVDPGKRGVL